MKSGKLRKILTPILIIGGAIGGLVILSSLSSPPEKKPEQQVAMSVETMPVEIRSLNLTVQSHGTVLPRTETTLVAEVSGKLVWVSPEFVAGGFFNRDDELLRIDPSDYKVAVNRAEAALAGRRAQLASERARAEQAVKDWNKLESRRGQTPSDLVLRKPQLAEAEANVKAAEADLEKAQRDLERTWIRAPYDLLVRQKAADIGQYVAPGTQLGKTFAVDIAEIRLPLSSADLAYVNLPTLRDRGSQPLRVRLSTAAAGRTHSWLAEIVRTEQVLDERTRVIHAVAQVRDPYGLLGEGQETTLPIGTFVKAEIIGNRAENVVTLPRHTVRNEREVLVAGKGSLLEIRQVEVIRADESNAYIASGLAAGERVITTAIEAPIPGTRLRLGDSPAGPSATSEISDGSPPDSSDKLAKAGEDQ